MTHLPNVPAAFLFTNHLLVLVLIQADPMIRIRELSIVIGMTERSTQRIINELEVQSLLEVSREGRRNHYRVVVEREIELPSDDRVTLGQLLATLPLSSTRR